MATLYSLFHLAHQKSRKTPSCSFNKGKKQRKISILLLSICLIPMSTNANSAFSDELTEAYTYAQQLNMVSKTPLAQAQLSEPITRAESAKILGIRAEHTLRIRTNPEINCQWSDGKAISREQLARIISICQRGIIDETNQQFRPQEILTRGEFAQMLSHALRGKLYDQTAPSKPLHLAMLKKIGIIQDDNPERKETKASLLLMLYRASKKVHIVAENQVIPRSFREAGCENPLTKISCQLGNPACPQLCQQAIKTAAIPTLKISNLSPKERYQDHTLSELFAQTLSS